jgi:hypothetical protein
MARSVASFQALSEGYKFCDYKTLGSGRTYGGRLAYEHCELAQMPLVRTPHNT